jgi:autophagy-related protein 9
MALFNLLLAPFLLLFLTIHFFMRNAERFYNHPGSIGSRRWTPLAKWRLREVRHGRRLACRGCPMSAHAV